MLVRLELHRRQNSRIQTSQAKIHIPATWIFTLSLGNTHRGCTVDQLSRLLWRRHLRIDTLTS
ncbi:hypothetical protein PITC_094620 [Penicillium italicum]|uniref:Uncharacterized protein n=1 Tax=Penicillium italicum TaxID=40296 RepID=A0A0A2KNG2_PENIT|nr:hypothetical protein PITC_094620 [Penicillium italicum]